MSHSYALLSAATSARPHSCKLVARKPLGSNGQTIGDLCGAVESLQDSLTDQAAIDPRLALLRDELDPPIACCTVRTLDVRFFHHEMRRTNTPTTKQKYRYQARLQQSFHISVTRNCGSRIGPHV